MHTSLTEVNKLVSFAGIGAGYLKYFKYEIKTPVHQTRVYSDTIN